MSCFHVVAHSAVVLKAETMAEKVEWLNKLRNVVLPSTGGQMKGESGLPLRQSLSDGSLVSHLMVLLGNKFPSFPFFRKGEKRNNHQPLKGDRKSMGLFYL